MGFDPVSYAMGAKAGGGGGGGGSTLEIVETTFTSATQTGTIVIPLPPKQKIPIAVEIITPATGAAIEDFPLGDVVSIFAFPVPDDDLVYKMSWNGLCTYRNAASGRTSIPPVQQKPSDTSSIVSGEYKILNDAFYTIVGSNGWFPQGVTYSVKCYYVG